MNSTHNIKYQKILKTASLISGIIAGVLALLLLLNYLQFSSSDPLESAVLDKLLTRLSSERDNTELINEIRHLDLLKRKAYFNSLWQIQILSYSTLFFAIVFLVSIRLYTKNKSIIRKPDINDEESSKTSILSQNTLIAFTVFIISLALTAGYFTQDKIEVYFTTQELKETIQKDDIEILEIIYDDTLISQEHTTDTSHKDIKKDTSSTITDKIEKEFILSEDLIMQNHNSFRGPWGNGISFKTNTPTNWDVNSGENIIWKTKIPIHGYNSPVLWDDRIFLTGGNENKRVVYCIDKNTGEIIWSRKADNIPGSPSEAPRTTDDTGLAAPTACVDGERVYAIFGTGDIIAFNFDGNRVWARNLGVPKNHYGHSSSLIVWNNKIFVQYDTMESSRLLALDTKTGNTVWETQRTDDISWSSPILTKINNKFKLIVLSLPGLSAYNIETGEQIWYVECMSGEVGTSPAYGGGLIYAGNEYAKFVAVNPQNGEVVWEDNYYLPEVSSPVYNEGLVYIATTYAVVSCFDAKTGEFIWEYDTGRGFYSSPIIADGKLYVFDMDGVCYIFEPGREPNLISSPKLGEEVYATPVFDNGRMYIRGNKHLYCIGSK